MTVTFPNDTNAIHCATQIPRFSDDDWDDLIDHIHQGRVIPLVGEGVTTFGSDNALLYPVLAAQLAERLGIPGTELDEEITVSLVAARHLSKGEVRNKIYSRLTRILEEGDFAPGATLQQLADIEGFSLYISTTCDALLEAALRTVRQRKCDSIVFYPKAPKKDLFCRMSQLPQPTVYHLLGRASGVVGEFVAWDEDLLDFLTELPRSLSPDHMRNLAQDLRENAILAVGLRFSDWVLRLALRIARQDNLGKVTQFSWLADGCEIATAQSTVLFFGSVSKTIRVIECGSPVAFVEELHRRWRRRYPKGLGSHPVNRRESSRGYVFISYAREDEVEARRIADALLDQDCPVYFDREQLGSGDDYDRELEAQVRAKCAVFVSVVSPFTESAEGSDYFRMERYWASKRLEKIAEPDRSKFYLPVLIHDEKPTELIREPGLTKTFQWTHCPKGNETSELVRSVRALLQGREQSS